MKGIFVGKCVECKAIRKTPCLPFDHYIHLWDGLSCQKKRMGVVGLWLGTQCIHFIENFLVEAKIQLMIWLGLLPPIQKVLKS